MLSKHIPPRCNKIEKSLLTAGFETRIALNASVVIEFDISLYRSRLERSRCGGGRFRVRLSQHLRLPG